MTAWQAEDRIVIKAPVEEIFETLLDYNNFGRLFGRGYSTRILGDEPTAKEGTIVAHELMGIRFRRRVEKIEPKKRITERYIGPNYEGSGTWELEPLPEGVELKYIYHAADTGWRSKLIYFFTGKRTHHFFYSSGLSRLRKRLERPNANSL